MENTKPWRLAPIRYGVIHLLYATALIASAGATFGAGGLIVSFLCIAFWLTIFLVEPIRYGLTTALLAALTLLAFGYCVILPFFVSTRGPHPRADCANHLKQIGLGLHNYHDVFGQLPPRYIADVNGKPLHSWRTLILPFTEHMPLYDRYNFGEAWNGPNNSQLHSQVPRYQQCYLNKPAFAGETSYVAVGGQGATWSSDQARKLSEFSHPTNKVVVVIETHHAGINWLEPGDFSLEQAIQELSGPDLNGEGGHRASGSFASRRITGHNVLLADGSVRFIPLISENVASDLLTGKCSDIDDIVGQDNPTRNPYGPSVGIVIFVALALLPSYWVVMRSNLERAVQDPVE